MAAQMTQRSGFVFEPDRVAAIDGGGTATRRETASGRARDASGAAAKAATAAALLVVWSLTYLYRQPAVEGATFSPFGNFALEGMLLAATWLGALATLCLAALGGVV